MAQLGPSAMSAIRLLSGAKRTLSKPGGDDQYGDQKAVERVADSFLSLDNKPGRAWQMEKTAFNDGFE